MGIFVEAQADFAKRLEQSTMNFKITNVEAVNQIPISLLAWCKKHNGEQEYENKLKAVLQWISSLQEEPQWERVIPRVPSLKKLKRLERSIDFFKRIAKDSSARKQCCKQMEAMI